MAQEDSRQEGRRAERWARVNFPNKFVHPHEYTARDGRVFDKMFVSIPPGVTLNGVDLGGYAFDHFAKPREIEQKANGRPVANLNGISVHIGHGRRTEMASAEEKRRCRTVPDRFPSANNQHMVLGRKGMTTPVRIQQSIRQLETKGLTHTQIARELGVSRTTVVKYATRDYSPVPPTGGTALRSGGVADSFDYAGYAYAAREDDDRQMWCSDDGYIVDSDLPNMPPLSARGLEDAVAALETGAAVMDPADPTNMAVTAAESGRAL